MEQLYDRYTAEHQEVWRRLFERQTVNLDDKAATAYLDCLRRMEPVLHASRIPRIAELNVVLQRRSGWSIHIVPGLIPAVDFLGLLSERRFCSSTWLRSLSQLDYLEEPDMFHDIYGHVPLFYDHRYSEFLCRVGELGRRYGHSEQAIATLERFYWFTIEFGLVREQGAMKLYGAGLMSSYGEASSVFTSSPVLRPFDLREIAGHSFVKSEMQHEYFVLSSFAQLYESLPELESLLEAQARTEKGLRLEKAM